MAFWGELEVEGDYVTSLCGDLYLGEGECLEGYIDTLYTMLLTFYYTPP